MKDERCLYLFDASAQFDTHMIDFTQKTISFYFQNIFYLQKLCGHLVRDAIKGKKRRFVIVSLQLFFHQQCRST